METVITVKNRKFKTDKNYFILESLDNKTFWFWQMTFETKEQAIDYLKMRVQAALPYINSTPYLDDEIEAGILKKGELKMYVKGATEIEGFFFNSKKIMMYHWAFKCIG